MYRQVQLVSISCEPAWTSVQRVPQRARTTHHQCLGAQRGTLRKLLHKEQFITSRSRDCGSTVRTWCGGTSSVANDTRLETISKLLQRTTFDHCLKVPRTDVRGVVFRKPFVQHVCTGRATRFATMSFRLDDQPTLR